jgi:hypothetical protein
MFGRMVICQVHLKEKENKKMEILNIVARLIVLGGWLFVSVWVWSIVRTPSPARTCFNCSRSLASVDVVMCSDCLGGSNA